MKKPAGMNLEEDECLEIRKGMYGLVQSARVFWQKITRCLLRNGFTQSKVDECLYIKEGKYGIIILL